MNTLADAHICNSKSVATNHAQYLIEFDWNLFFPFCDRDCIGAKCWWEKGRTHIFDINNDNYHQTGTSRILMAGRGIFFGLSGQGICFLQVRVSVSGCFPIPHANLNPSANPQILEE